MARGRLRAAPARPPDVPAPCTPRAPGPPQPGPSGSRPHPPLPALPAPRRRTPASPPPGSPAFPAPAEPLRAVPGIPLPFPCSPSPPAPRCPRASTPASRRQVAGWHPLPGRRPPRPLSAAPRPRRPSRAPLVRPAPCLPAPGRSRGFLPAEDPSFLLLLPGPRAGGGRSALGSGGSEDGGEVWPRRRDRDRGLGKGTGSSPGLRRKGGRGSTRMLHPASPCSRSRDHEAGVWDAGRWEEVAGRGLKAEDVRVRLESQVVPCMTLGRFPSLGFPSLQRGPQAARTEGEGCPLAPIPDAWSSQEVTAVRRGAEGNPHHQGAGREGDSALAALGGDRRVSVARQH